ncbi:MAG: hypothetical protein KKI02_00800 [Planctomycetes bacterium]|nr:hypothetical protein [Planctomycetota bacterium]
MSAWTGPTAAAASLGLGALLAGCGLVGEVTNMFNPDLLSSLGMGANVATLPGDAPGLLVAVENRTSRWASMVVSYRDSEDKVRNYTTLVAPGDKSAQMLVCPIGEITLGDVSNLKQTGARVYLLDTATADPNSVAVAPFIEVDAFGVLLSEEVNYDCGDGVTFALLTSSTARSGYQAYAFIRRAGTE